MLFIHANGLVTCIFVCVCECVRHCVYFIAESLFFSFNVQITYECYEVLKSKSPHNMVTFDKCLEYTWQKDSLEICGKPVTKWIRFRELFSLWCNQNRKKKKKKCRFDGGWRKIDCLWGSLQFDNEFPSECQVKNSIQRDGRKKIKQRFVCTNLNFIAMKISGARWTFVRMKWKKSHVSISNTESISL